MIIDQQGIIPSEDIKVWKEREQREHHKFSLAAIDEVFKGPGLSEADKHSDDLVKGGKHTLQGSENLPHLAIWQGTTEQPCGKSVFC